MTGPRPAFRSPHAVAILIGLTLVAYRGVVSNDFVAYDDEPYVTENPFVLQGLSWKGVRWAFTSTAYQYNWHPLTWISHMLDVGLYGLDPSGHHVTSLALHVAATLLCFFALKRMTAVREAVPSSRATPSAFLVAALFAWHPLRVESVAWVAERKDVLAGVFFFLTLLLYARYAERRTRWRYMAVLASFGLGLMAKPMLITLPFVLLLVDSWPLGRWRTEGFPRLLLEKAPLLVLAGLSGAITLHAQHAGGALNTLASLPFGARAVNAIVSCAVYLEKSVWPVHLAVFHPHPALVAPEHSRMAALFVSAALLVAVSALVLRLRRDHPCLLVGWLWFLGMLVPVLGLVQVGDQAWAERYAYLPLVGVYVAVVFGLAGAPARLRAGAGLVGSAMLVAFLFQTARQVRVWRDSRALFTHALRVTEKNYLAHGNLGRVVGDAGDLDAALEQFEAATAIAPGFYEAWLNRGKAHYKLAAPMTDAAERGAENDQAVAAFERAVELAPGEAEAHFCLGAAYASAGDLDRAEAELEEALRLRPDYPPVQRALAQVRELLEAR